jgi:hypothetical protein
MGLDAGCGRSTIPQFVLADIDVGPSEQVQMPPGSLRLTPLFLI